MPRKFPLYRYLANYFQRTPRLEMKPGIILDTSAIIDLERASQRMYGVKQAYTFVSKLKQTGPDTELIIPLKIQKEIKQHSRHKIAGRPEISSETLDSLLQNAQDYDNFIGGRKRRNMQRQAQQRLQLARELYAEINPPRQHLSRADWSVIDTTFWLGFISQDTAEKYRRSGRNIFKGCYKIATLSSDNLLLKTINYTLKHPDYVCLLDFVLSVDVRRYSVA